MRPANANAFEFLGVTGMHWALHRLCALAAPRDELPGPSAYSCPNSCAYFSEFGRRYLYFVLGMPFSPIKALDLICQNCARARARNHHFEGIILNLRRHRATDHETRLHVARGGAQHNCGPLRSLFMSGLWIEADPHNVTGVGHIRPRNYNAS